METRDSHTFCYGSAGKRENNLGLMNHIGTEGTHEITSLDKEQNKVRK